MTEGTRWSYSRLAAYLSRCSLQYYFRYVERIEPERTSSRLAFGSAIHTGLEAAHRSWESGKPVPLEVAQAAFAADLVIRLQDPILEFREGETPESLLDQGKALLTAWAAEPASSFVRSSTDSRWKVRPATSTSNPWAPFSSTIASNCLPSSMIE